jgi:hypothetical protein
MGIPLFLYESGQPPPVAIIPKCQRNGSGNESNDNERIEKAVNPYSVSVLGMDETNRYLKRE